MTDTQTHWEKALEISRNFDPQYNVGEDCEKTLFDLAVALPKGSTIFEVGICNGKMSSIFAYVAKIYGHSYYGLDDFSLTANEKQVREMMDKYDLPYTFLVGRSGAVPWDKPIDLLFIDGGHYEEAVKADCETYLPHLKPGGIIAFDDWNEFPERGSNAHWAIPYYGELHTRGWEELSPKITKLKVKRKPNA